jgi:hypothetical protein
MTTIEEIAERFRVGASTSLDAGYDAVQKFVGEDGFEMAHVPPMTGDGKISRAQYLKIIEEQSRIAPERIAGYRWEDVQTEVAGSNIIMTATITGTLPDGDPLQLDTKTVFTITDGLISRVESSNDAKGAEQLRTALGL